MPGAGDPAPPALGSPAWIEAALKARLGPRARLGAITFEGRLLHLRDVSLPLGPGAVLTVSHAVVELGAGLPLGDLPLSLRLAHFDAVVVAGSGERAFHLPIHFTAEEGAEPAWVHGSLLLGAVVTSTLSIRPSGWSLAGDTLSAAGPLRPPGLTRLRIHGLPLSLLPELPGGITLGGALDADLEAAGDLADLRIQGSLSAAAIDVQRPGRPGLRATGISVRVDADRRGLRYRDLAASLCAAGRDTGAAVRGWGSVPFASSPHGAGDPLLAVQIEGVDAALLSSLAPLPLPPDVALTGELAVRTDRSVSGQIAIETPRSALLLTLSIDPEGALLGTTLRGRFTAGDAAAAGLGGGPVGADPDDVLTADGRLTGSITRPGLIGRLSAARLSLRLGGDEARPPLALEVEDASVLLDIGASGLSWQQLTGRFYGGRFSASGRLGRATGALEATVACTTIHLEDLPSRAPGEPALGALVTGLASGSIRFERESRAPRSLRAHGHLRVEDPVYPFVRRFASTLARYGLPAVPRRGAGPLTAEVRLARGEIRIDPASASVDGIDVEGSLLVEDGGRLDGQVHVHLRESYLSRSPLLALPAALADRVTIPVYFQGPPGKLAVQTDAREILDGLLQGSRAGRTVKSAIEEVRGIRSRWGTRRR